MFAGYHTRKAAQAAAFFAIKNGGQIPQLKLLKLLYLADREHLDKYDMPILFDCYVSMKKGPVPSLTRYCIQGRTPDKIKADWSKVKAEWGEFIDDEAIAVSVRKNVSDVDLDEFNKIERGSLEAVWNKFGRMNGGQLSTWTHEHCGEWEAPPAAPRSISYKRILECLGKKNPEAVIKNIEVMRAIDAAAQAE